MPKTRKHKEPNDDSSPTSVATRAIPGNDDSSASPSADGSIGEDIDGGSSKSNSASPSAAGSPRNGRNDKAGRSKDPSKLPATPLKDPVGSNKKKPSPMRRKTIQTEQDQSTVRQTKNVIYTMGFKDGVQGAYALRTRDQTVHTYVWPVKQLLESGSMGPHENALAKTMIAKVAVKCVGPDDDSELDAGTRVNEATRRKFGDSFVPHSHIFLRFKDDASKNTKESRMKFGEKVTKAFNQIGMDKALYNYDETFRYGGDVTGDVDQDSYLPLAHVVRNSEVVEIVRQRYDAYSDAELADDDNLLAMYAGRDRILELAQRIDAETVTRRRQRSVEANQQPVIDQDDSSDLSDA